MTMKSKRNSSMPPAYSLDLLLPIVRVIPSVPHNSGHDDFLPIQIHRELGAVLVNHDILGIYHERPKEFF